MSNWQSFSVNICTIVRNLNRIEILSVCISKEFLGVCSHIPSQKKSYLESVGHSVGI